MRSDSFAVELVRLWSPDSLRRAAPGIALCAAIAAVAFVADLNGLLHFGRVWVPPLILTLAIGMALHPLSLRPALKPGLEFSGRTLLRLGVALYGARLTLGQLVDGGALPTSTSAEPPAPANPAKVSLQHGESAGAEARFSPDVNGTGDNAPGQCQPTATVLRVTAPGGGTLDAPIQPPTPVCERGSLHFRVFASAP